MSRFQPAQRLMTKLRILLTGLAGSGKTLSALRLAWRLAQREAQHQGRQDNGVVFVLDSESHRSAVYIGNPWLPPWFTFSVGDIHPPYSHVEYIKAIDEAVVGGCDVLIIDSVTHAWGGQGGLQDTQSRLSKSMGQLSWAEIKPLQRDLMTKLTTNAATPVHTIVTCRAKPESKYDPEKGATVRTGDLVPDFRQNVLEYEFLLCFHIDRESHIAAPRKDNTGIFDGIQGKREGIINEMYADWLFDWYLHGAATPPPPSGPSVQAAPQQALPPAQAVPQSTPLLLPPGTAPQQVPPVGQKSPPPAIGGLDSLR